MVLGASLGLGVLPGAANEGSRVSGGKGLHPASIDRLAFGPQRDLFIADTQGVTLYAVPLDPTTRDTPGLKSVTSLDKTIAAMMGPTPTRSIPPTVTKPGLIAIPFAAQPRQVKITKTGRNKKPIKACSKVYIPTFGHILQINPSTPHLFIENHK